MNTKIPIKSFNKLERIVRGFSNHRRIQLLELLYKQPELSVLDISNLLHLNLKTAADHLRRLAIAGLILKRHDNRSVRHKLTKLGQDILMFLRTLEH